MWIAAISLAVLLVGVIVLAMRRRHRGGDERDSGAQPWDESKAPSDDSWAKNAQYYSKY